ncbi:MAG TPA: amino acid adenylation domain-containing protein, partial [Ktedonobacteraceae bacterium]|nr:amino acid adenylation domain-containing protein [Ktedonobacteraceae bacterium]
STLQSTLRARYPGWQARHVFLRRKPSYPLTLYIFAEAEILAKLVYAPGRFSAATMQRMLAQLRNVLCQMVATPDMTLADLRLLTAEERQQILFTWNSTTHDHDTRPIHEQVAARAAACPHRLAIQSGASGLTYAQLNRQANRLAHFLRAQGVGPERRVGICMARSPDMIIAQLGVLKAGGAFVSLDPDYPAERLNFLLRDARVTLLLTSRHLLPVFAQQPLQALALDEEPGVLAAWSEENPPSRLAPSNLAYIIYTSGSTGTPKGVALQHDGLANLVSWHRRTYGLNMLDRTTHLASPAFDASVWEIWPSLTVGASLHLPARETLLDPHALVAWFTAHAITLAFLPTPLGEAVLQEEWPRESRLRALLVGGDRLQRPPRAALPFQLYNHYGPSETTVVATWTEVSPSASPELPPPIGRPVDNTRIYLLDEAGQPVPVGVPGELFIGGTGLARGYLSRPDLTAERFLPDPWSTQPGGRLYRSGDLARYRSDGQIEFLGRRDQQIKLRGHRIEPGEIEATLLHYPGVATALVNLSMGSPQNREQDQVSASSGPFLVAYIVAQTGQTLSSEALRHFLSQKLPPYMVPTSFLFLDALPLTPSGKIDRRALPAPRLLTDAPAEEKPRTALEITLAEIWTQVLNPVRSFQETSLNIHESFFEMGGHSLLAAQVVLHVNKKLHLHLPIQSLFQAPSIAQMAALISAQQGDQEDEVSAIPRLDRSRYRTRKG